MTLDGFSQSDVTETMTTPSLDRLVCYGVFGPGAHTLVLTVSSVDAFVLDGYYVDTV